MGRGTLYVAVLAVLAVGGGGEEAWVGGRRAVGVGDGRGERWVGGGLGGREPVEVMVRVSLTY